MITITNLSKSYGKRILFDNVSLKVNPGEKIGLIGPNGAGKTTFFSIILGKTDASDSSVQIKKNVRIGYLPQETSFTSGRTVLLELTEGDEAIIKLKKEKEELEAADKTVQARYGEILHELEALGYFELEHKAKKILAGLGFKQKDFSRPISELSGGWQMRVLLAKLLTCHYDILLLDEPTNYLDLGAALWFKDYLAGFKGTFIMISHDRAFLEEVTNYTLVLENGSLNKVRGNYEHYLKIREEKRGYALKQFKEQEKKKQQLQQFVYRFHAQPNKAAQVRAKRRVIEKMEEVIVPFDVQESIRNFQFPSTQSSGYRVIALEGVTKSYADNVVYKNFDFELTRGERVVLTGENGAGKSTLLKILAGVLSVDCGRRLLGHNVAAGYFSQTRMEVLNAYNTVLEEASAAAGGSLSGEAVRTILGAFLFSGDDVDKSVSVLSGGEKSRLILAKLLINPPNFLLFDEPTTHLDVDAVEALIKALAGFAGTIVFISHDIYFVRSVANAVYEVSAGQVRKFPGNFDYYQDKKKNSELISAVEDRDRAAAKREIKQQDKLSKEEKQEKRKIHNAPLARKINDLRKKRKSLETKKYVIERVLSNPRHSKETVKDYHHRLERCEKKIYAIDEEIKKIKTKFL